MPRHYNVFACNMWHMLRVVIRYGSNASRTDYNLCRPINRVGFSD